jgi:hypothetical protein
MKGEMIGLHYAFVLHVAMLAAVIPLPDCMPQIISKRLGIL